jgi:hypothetical protein
MSVQYAGHHKGHEIIYPIVGAAQRELEVHKLAVRIDIEVKRPRSLETAHVYRTLQVDELEPENDLCEVGWVNTSPSKLNQSWIVRAPDEVTPERQRIDTCRAR